MLKSVLTARRSKFKLRCTWIVYLSGMFDKIRPLQVKRYPVLSLSSGAAEVGEDSKLSRPARAARFPVLI